MIGAVHASIGAAVGSFFKSKAAAFAAGVLSHIVADVIPHKDLDPKIEVPLLAGAIAAVAELRGVDSPEFWGAVGGILPDAEHGLMVAGLIRQEQEVFPTHVDDGRYHGRETDQRWSQLINAAASILTVLLNKDSRP